MAPEQDPRPDAYQRTGEMLRREAEWDEFLTGRMSLGTRLFGALFETLAETFWPKARLKRAEREMDLIRTGPDYQDLVQTLAEHPELRIVDVSIEEGTWRMAYFNYVDVSRRNVRPHRRREDRATHFVVYFESRFKPHHLMLQKDLKDGSWRFIYPPSFQWRQEVPELLWEGLLD
jgi:hypothetical protein